MGHIGLAFANSDDMRWGVKSVFLLCFLHSFSFAEGWFDSLVDQVPTDDFCGVPYYAICHSKDTSPGERKKRIDDLKRRVRAKAIEALGREPRNFAENAVLVGHISRITEQEIATVELEAAVESSRLVKNYLMLAIDEQAGLGTISSDEQKAMKSIVARTRIKTSADFRKKSKGRFTLSTMGYYMTCGMDGMSDNAFASHDSYGPFIILCPGWLLRAVGGGYDRLSNFHNLLQVMAHEFAHHIDADVFGGVYPRLRACLVGNYSDDMAYGTTELDRAMKFLEKTFAKSLSDLYKVNRHMSEITADYWAGLTVKQYLKETPEVLRLQVVREAWSGYCDTRDEGVHPAGKFRMTVLMATDPEMRKLMGCSRPLTQNSPHCSLAGALF